MSTVAEIEKAIEQLPAEQRQEIRCWMDRKLPKTADPSRLVPPPDVPKAELQRVHALIEAEFSQIDAKGW